MAAVAEPGSSSESGVARPPAKSRDGGALEGTQLVEYAVRQALDLKQTLSESADAAFRTTESSLALAVSASRSGLQETRGMMEWVKGQYAVGEELVFGKIKEGVLVAASHPGLSLGITATAGLVLFKRPRRSLIWNVRRIFVSNESLLSDAQAKVNELRQSVNLMKNESKKLEERALKAEQEMREGRMKLIEEGHGIRNELHHVNKIERKVTALKDLMNDLPVGEASRFRSQVSPLVSQVKKEKKALSGALSKIINYGIPM